MPAPGSTRDPALADRTWLAAQLAAGRSGEAIAADIACSMSSVRRAMRTLKLEAANGGRHGEPMPMREFKPLAGRLEPAAADVDVAPDELARRLFEGLTGLRRAGAAGGRAPTGAVVGARRGRGRRPYSAGLRVRCGVSGG